MQYREFIESIESGEMPDVSLYLQALWLEARGDWHGAHEIVQQLEDTAAARIHAYLHRVEGDDWNSRYWHNHAGSSFPEHMSLEEEWQMLVQQHLDEF